MRKSLFQFVMLMIATFVTTSFAYSANEYFRSIVNGNWNSPSTWEMSINSGSTWFPATAFPADSSGVITVRNPNTVTVNSNAIADQLVVNSSGSITIGAGIFLTITDGTGIDLSVASGGAISGPGTVRTQGTDILLVVSGSSNFSAPFIVSLGGATAYDNISPFTGIFRGAITVNNGTTLFNPGGGYSIQANNTVTNNGTISGSTFRMRGSSFINNGSVTVNEFNFDSTTTVSGNQPFTGNNISINSSGNVSFSSNMTFSPVVGFSVNSGGILNPASLTVSSGTMNVNPGSAIANTGTLRTSGSPILNVRENSNFNAPLIVVSGTTSALSNISPFTAIFRGTITINNGATLFNSGGGYSIQSNGNVVNNGSITGSTFRMRGASFVNNGTVSISDFNFDSTTTVSGTQPFTDNNINVNSSGNISFSGSVTFSPVSNFSINSGGILNPTNLRVSSGTMNVNPGGTVANTGSLRTLGNPTLNVRENSNFNASIIVVSGTTSALSQLSPFTAIFKGTITINSGATLFNSGGGYSIQANGNVTNNGTISGSTFRMRGAQFINNNLVTITDLNFDSTTTVSATQPFTGNSISINGSGNVSFSGNVTFSPVSNFNINSGGVLNPGGLTFNKGTMNLNPGGTVANTGTLKTELSPVLNIRSGSNFEGTLNVVSGTTGALNIFSPFTGIFKGTIIIDSAATLFNSGGGYSIQAEGDVINNGTISGSTFRFAGPTFTNNRSVTITTFNFNSGTHTLQGTGNWSTTANILSGSTTTLGSNHQMHSININSGGTFNLSTFKMSLTASNPIVNSGTFANTTGIVEYNGSSSQLISTANIVYSRLRINNAFGTTLPAAVTVNDTLSVVVGSLNLNGFILTISPTGYLTEASGNTVRGSSGYITTTRTLNAPSNLNVGGLGAVLTTAANLGVTEIRRGHGVQSGLNGNTSILRYFDILPLFNTGLNATLVFKYDLSELNGKTEGALSLFRSTNSGSTWTPRGGTVNVPTKSITLGAIDEFSRWSASSVPSQAAQISVIPEGFYNTANNRLNMRDTVRAYLRNNTTPYAVVDSALSIIDSTVFSGNFNFVNALSGTYYIQIKHRNSIETWSKSPGQAYVLGSALVYNFTTAAAQAFGNNMVQKGSRFCIYSGDITQNGGVDGQDLAIADNQAFNFVTGYVSGDVNGDRVVDAADVAIVDNNAFNFVTRVIP